MYWYLEVWRKFADFSGRARRKEYWMFLLFNVIVGIILNSIDLVGGLYIAGAFGILNTIYVLASLIPVLAVSVRRLHDTGRSGWWLLISLIPFLGTVVILYFFLLEGDPASNRFGPNPKAGSRSTPPADHRVPA